MLLCVQCMLRCWANQHQACSGLFSRVLRMQLVERVGPYWAQSVLPCVHYCTVAPTLTLKHAGMLMQVVFRLDRMQLVESF